MLEVSDSIRLEAYFDKSDSQLQEDLKLLPLDSFPLSEQPP